MGDYTSAYNHGSVSALQGGHPPHLVHLPSPEGVIEILRRYWRSTTVVAGLTVLVTGLYLLIARPLYTSESKIRVEPLGQPTISGATGVEISGQGGEGQISGDFLATECDVITSNPVLALALSRIGETRTFAGINSPLEYLKNNLTAEVAKRGQTIVVSFESHYPDEANRIVAAVVDAYQKLETDHLKKKVHESLDLLESGKARQRQDLTTKTQRMLELARQGGATDTQADKSSLRARVRDLSQAVAAADLDTINSKLAYDESLKGIVGNSDKMEAVAIAHRQSAHLANPDEQYRTLQEELMRAQTRFSDAGRQYMPNHPAVKSAQTRIDQLTVACVVAAEQWWQQCQAKEDALQKSLDEAQHAALDQEAHAVEYMQLASDVSQLKKMDEVVDVRVQDLEVIRGAGATNITVINAAAVVGPPKPLKARTMLIGLAFGLIGGLGVACVRSRLDDRLRTPEAVKTSAGAPILGSIPAITSGFNAVDRGKVVHDDPFVDAAECYRALHKALQTGLPARTKTLLITSPAAGDGKSTFVSNLGIAMAQASRRVLIVDADLRAPVQHRVFGVKDRVGLSTVMMAGDTLAQAIQRTVIEGLDLLPCGPTPTSPTEMLNDPAFADHLNDLADKYDVVLIDSSSVTTAADARILAASADATLLIVRPDGSTRKQVEEARDGLRGVGARVIGVAMNAVAREAIRPTSAARGSHVRPATMPAALRSAARRAERKIEPTARPTSRT
jgi:succinoglycan biosynthesis transport protein ExoP